MSNIHHYRNSFSSTAINRIRASYESLKEALKKNSNYQPYFYTQRSSRSHYSSSPLFTSTIPKTRSNTRSKLQFHKRNVPSDKQQEEYSYYTLPTAQSEPSKRQYSNIFTNNTSIYQSTDNFLNPYEFIPTQNEKREKEIQSLLEQYETLKIINNELQSNFDDIKVKLAHSNKLKDDEISKLIKDKVSLKEYETTLYEINNHLNKSLEEYKNVIGKMKKTMGIISDKQKELSSTDTIQKKFEQFNNALNEKNEQLNKLIGIHNELQHEIECNDIEIEKVKTELNSNKTINDEISKLKSQIDEFAKKIEQLYKAIDQKDKIINIIKENYGKLNQKLDKLPEEKNKLSKRKIINQSKVNYMKEKKKQGELLNKFEDMQKITEEMLRSGKMMKEHFEKEISKLKEEIENKKESIAKMNIDVNDKEFNDLLNENEKLQKDFKMLITKIKEFPKIEKVLKEIIEMNISLKQSNLELAKGLNLEEILKE